MIGSSGEPKQVCIVNRLVISRQTHPASTPPAR